MKLLPFEKQADKVVLYPKHCCWIIYNRSVPDSFILGINKKEIKTKDKEIEMILTERNSDETKRKGILFVSTNNSTYHSVI